MALVYALLAVLGGALFPAQTAINAQLARLVGGALPATIVSFVVGLTALGLIYLVGQRGHVDLAAFRAVPPPLLVGGLLGATFLGLSVFLTPRVGSGALICLVVAGQVIAALLIDGFGLFGLPVRDPSPTRLAGAAFVALGVILVRWR